MDLYSELAQQIGLAKFEEAFRHVLKTSKFRPDIADLYEAAGVKPETEIEWKARNAFQVVAPALRKHWGTVNGEKGLLCNMRRWKDRTDDGRMLPQRDWVEIFPPRGPVVFGPITEAALLDIGLGSRVAGLEALYAHPKIMESDEKQDIAYSQSRAERIEAMWMAAFKRAAMEVENGE